METLTTDDHIELSRSSVENSEKRDSRNHPLLPHKRHMPLLSLITCCFVCRLYGFESQSKKRRMKGSMRSNNVSGEMTAMVYCIVRRMVLKTTATVSLVELWTKVSMSRGNAICHVSIVGTFRRASIGSWFWSYCASVHVVTQSLTSSPLLLYSSPQFLLHAANS